MVFERSEVCLQFPGVAFHNTIPTKEREILPMKVCAHYILSPYQHRHRRFNSAAEAKHWLWNYLIPQGNLAPYNPDYPVVMDLYPQCQDCNSTMNFHDDIMTRYKVGPRGGIRRVTS